jgi:hypothetical protein
VLSGKDLSDKLITRPEESYRLWRVVVCDHENLVDEEAIARDGLHSQKKLYMKRDIYGFSKAAFKRLRWSSGLIPKFAGSNPAEAVRFFG